MLKAGRQLGLFRNGSPEAISVRVLHEDLTVGPLLWAFFCTTLLQLWSRVASRPALVFMVLSLAFGVSVSIVVPPLRGPDEIAHFLRIHSYARGVLLPDAEVDGRKGIFVSGDLHREISFFKDAGERFAREREQGLRYGSIMEEYRPASRLLSHEEPEDTASRLVSHEEPEDKFFMPFAGTEGYNPAAYVPYIMGAVLGDVLGLDFPVMLLVMRLLGVLAFTAAIAYAIRLTPAPLKWAFALIAMLPVALYNRSVLSADGAALASALVVTALCFSGTRRVGRLWERSLWMTLCSLSKQPQIVFVLLEGMLVRKQRRPAWSSLALVVVPSLILSPLWIIAVSADIAAWRLLESEAHPPEHFDPLWKLAYIWEHPLHFPQATWTALSIQGERLWQELIGILGWQDILLGSWTYVCLTVLLLLAPIQQLQMDSSLRVRLMLIAGLVVVAYVVTVYLIFFLTYTPIDIDHVRGVQGRYFVIILPVAALFVAAALNFALPHNVPAMAAVLGALWSGIVCFHALLDVHWLDP